MNITISTAPSYSPLDSSALVFRIAHNGRQYSGNTYQQGGKWHVHAVAHDPIDADEFRVIRDFYGVIENTEAALHAHLVAKIPMLDREPGENFVADFDLSGK